MKIIANIISALISIAIAIAMFIYFDTHAILLKINDTEIEIDPKLLSFAIAILLLHINIIIFMIVNMQASLKTLKSAIEEDRKIISGSIKSYNYYSKIQLRWKERYLKNMDKFNTTSKLLSEGRHIIDSMKDLMEYQIKLIGEAQVSIYAIHRAIDADSLRRWNKRNTKDFFKRLIHANEQIGSGVKKRRIFILDAKKLFDSRDREQNSENMEIFKSILREQISMNFNVGILDSTVDMPDLLICDDKELIKIDIKNGNPEGEACIIPETIRSTIENFNNNWTTAEKNFNDNYKGWLQAVGT